MCLSFFLPFFLCPAGDIPDLIFDSQRVDPLFESRFHIKYFAADLFFLDQCEIQNGKYIYIVKFVYQFLSYMVWY